MKRTFYLYKYHKRDGLSDYLLLFGFSEYIKKCNKTMGHVSIKDSNYTCIITNIELPPDLFFYKDISNIRPIYVKYPLLSSFEIEDNYYYPSNENMDRYRRFSYISNYQGPLDLFRYTIGININLEGLGII